MEGEGLWDRLNKTKIKLPITKKQVEGVKHALTKGTRDNWPPQSRTLFAKYGDRRVLPNSFVACRYPISTNEMVKNVANLLGRKIPHDDLFHLQILFSVEGAPELAIDKNEDMRLRTAKHKRARPEMECIPLQYNGPTMTLNEMVDNTMKLMGKEKFFSYSSFLNNCQDFVLNFMKANQLSGDMAWIKQDIADLLPKWAKKLADVGTDFKNIQKLVMEGKGISGPSVKKNYLDLISDAEYWLEQEPWSATTNAWLNVLFKARQLVEEDNLEEAWELIKPFEPLWGGIGASASTSSTTGQGISGGVITNETSQRRMMREILLVINVLTRQSYQDEFSDLPDRMLNYLLEELMELQQKIELDHNNEISIKSIFDDLTKLYDSILLTTYPDIEKRLGRIKMAQKNPGLVGPRHTVRRKWPEQLVQVNATIRSPKKIPISEKLTEDQKTKYKTLIKFLEPLKALILEYKPIERDEPGAPSRGDIDGDGILENYKKLNSLMIL